MNECHEQLLEKFNELTYEAVYKPHSNYSSTYKAVHEIMNNNLLT